MKMDTWRVAVLGDGGVGKTALAVQFALNCFVGLCPHACSNSLPPVHTIFLALHPYSTETYDPTIEDSYRKQLVVDSRMCLVEVIDTAGQEEYATLRDQWVREAQGFILVYSITSRSTFDRLEIFRQSMSRVNRSPVFMLVGNKSDKTDDREVSRAEGAALARQLGCKFMETSAKTTANVDSVFNDLVMALRHPNVEPGVPALATKVKKKKSSMCVVM